jgi:hypothetical protein
VVTDPADEPSEPSHLLACSGTWTLQNGTLTTHGRLAYSSLSDLPLEGVAAITGGTGAYIGARGEQHLMRRGATELVSTFSYTTR